MTSAIKKITRTLALGVTLVLGSNAAVAGMITFDPFPSIPADVTVQYFDNGLTGPLASLPTANATDLVSAFSAIPSGGSALLLSDTRFGFGPYGMLLTFSSLQSFVAATGNDFGGNPDTDNEIAHLSLFDTGGSLIGSASFSSAWATPNLKTVSYNAGTNQIKYAAFTYTVDVGYYAVDNVAYRAQVPEPVSLALLGLGLAGLAVARRRKSA